MRMREDGKNVIMDNKTEALLKFEHESLKFLIEKEEEKVKEEQFSLDHPLNTSSH